MYTQHEVFHAVPGKSAWISLLSMPGICGIYFWAVIHAAPQAGGFRSGGLLETSIALVVVQVVLTVAAAMVTPKEAKAPRDEREKLIELKATRIAYSGLATSVALACFFGAFSPPIVFNTNALLFVLVTAELLRSSCQIIPYRRGA
jgi:hypothetical protein